MEKIFVQNANQARQMAQSKGWKPGEYIFIREPMMLKGLDLKSCKRHLILLTTPEIANELTIRENMS